MNNDEVIRLILETKGADGLKELAREADKAAAELKMTDEAADKVETATKKLEASGRASGRSFLELGRVAQDFTQGGVAGIINNLEGLATSLGLGAGLAGAATLAGVAFLIAKPHVVAFLDSLGGGSSEKIKTIKERLEDVGKALDALASKAKLTNAETREYIKLAQEQGKLDKENAENKAKLAAMAAQPKGPAPDKSIGEKVTEAASGNQDYIASHAGLGLLNQVQRQKRAIFDKGAGATPADLAELERLDAQSLDLRGHEKDAGAELLTKAMGGDVEAARKLISLLPDGAIRDDLVKATTSDRTKAEARFAGRQFLDNTLGRGARSIGDANREAREARAAKENNAAIDLQTNAALDDKREKEAAKEKQDKAAADRADADTTRLKEQTNAVKKAADDKEHDLKYEATTEDTDIDEMATKQLAGLRGEGGGYDDYGRFRRMSSKQMTDLVRKNVDAELKRMFPTESQETRDAVGSRIVDHSIGEVNKSVAKASADASRQGISTNEAVYNAMAALIRNTEAKFVEQRRKFEQLGSQLDRRTQGVKVYMSRVRR